MNGSRSAARIGGSTRVEHGDERRHEERRAASARAPTPGTTAAAIHTAAAPTTQETSVRSRPSRGVAGSQRVSSP